MVKVIKLTNHLIIGRDNYYDKGTNHLIKGKIIKVAVNPPNPEIYHF